MSKLRPRVRHSLRREARVQAGLEGDGVIH
jgi:hypothetical protein